jgi:alkanesulfonate monooxygenase SsuD/methylene tetrahydromethanopterin reductase-like flavin-dependent oxidoreductase (luciferase family)
MYPKPLQARVPVLLGGETDHTLRRVVEFCDGWFPRAGAGFDPAVAVARLRGAAEAGRRDPASLTTSVFRAPPDAAALAGYREAGITRVLLEVPDLDRDGILRRLDELAPLAKP